jgi:peptidoglycan/xylan/chitin deacetylase (PgdA/CDA1 family)
MTHRVTILAYHGLDETRSVVAVPPELFRWQMAWLAKANACVMPLGTVVDRLHQNRPLPRKAVAITFDDGYASVHQWACPVLAQHGFPATVFVVAGYCGRKNDWPGQPPQVRPAPLLSWSQVEALDRNGVEIGAHTIDHPRLDLLPADEVQHQVLGGKVMIEERLGHAIHTFAYPYGRYTPQVKQIVSRSFTGACTARPGTVDSASDPWLLDRIDAAYVSRPSLFTLLLSPIFPLYVALRRTARAQASRRLQRSWI